MKLLRLSFLLSFCVLLQLSASHHNVVQGTVVQSSGDHNIAVGTVVNAQLDRAAVEAKWEADLYPYQLADVRRALVEVSDADFPEFEALVNAHLMPTANDNVIAGYNAEIVVSFAKLARDRRVLLAIFMQKLCKDMDEDDKAESAKILSGMISGLTELPIVEVMVENIPVEMSGFEKKKLLKSLSKISPDSFFAFCQMINRVSPLFYTPDHKKALYLRLVSIVDDNNKVDFREVANIPLEVLQAVEAHLRDSNRMINFIVDLINKNPHEREAFIAANMK
jgi:hypothetical protein